MAKSLIALLLAFSLLSGCAQTVNKYSGQVVEVENSIGGRYCTYTISYDVGGGKYKLDTVQIDRLYSTIQYKLKDKVTVFANNDGIREIVK